MHSWIHMSPVWCFLTLFCACLEAQISIDTVSSDGSRMIITEYYDEGLPKRVVHASRIEPSLSKADLFMHGIAPQFDNRNYLIDSLKVFLKNGTEVQPTAADFDAVSLQYDVSSNAGQSIRDNQHIKHLTFGQVSYPKALFIEGKIGEVIDTHVVLAYQFARPEVFTVPHSGSLITSDSVRLLGSGEQVIPVRVPVGFHDKKYILRLEHQQGDNLDIEIISKGYDLTAADFMQDRSSHRAAFILQDRALLVLKSDGIEKLIRLRQGARVVEHFPYGQIRTEINLEGYQKGEYTLEAIDLTSNEVSALPLILK